MDINSDAPYNPIFCGDFEVLELACMRRYDIRIKVPGQTLTGRAVDLENNTNAEFIVLEGASETHRIRFGCLKYYPHSMVLVNIFLPLLRINRNNQEATND